MNLKGSTIIEDNDGEIVLSVPKAKSAPAEGAAPATPQSPLEKLNAAIPGAATKISDWGIGSREPQAAKAPGLSTDGLPGQAPSSAQVPLRPVDNEQMLFDPRPRRELAPGEVEPNQMAAEVDAFVKATGKAPKTTASPRPGPVKPAQASKTAPSAPLPTDGGMEDPDALAGQQAGLAENAAATQEKAADQMAGAEAAQIAGEALAKSNQASEMERQQKEIADRIKELEDAEAERQEQFRQQMVAGDTPERSLGNRFLWALATFMAGVGGKGETVMAMLTKELDRQAATEARRVAAAQKGSKTANPNAQELNMLKRLSYDRKLRAAIAKTEKEEKLAKTPVAKAKAQVAKAGFRAEKDKNLQTIVKDRFQNTEKQRKENWHEIGNAGQDPGKRIPLASYKDKREVSFALVIPGAKDPRTKSPLTYRIQTDDESIARAVREQIVSTKKMLKLSNEVMDLNKKSGVSELVKLPTNLRYKAESKIKQMQAIKKDLLRLGQLTDSDYSFLEAIIPSNIVSITGQLRPKMETLQQATRDEAFQLFDTYGIPRDEALITPAR